MSPGHDSERHHGERDGSGGHHVHRFGRFGPLKAFAYFFLHPSGVGNRVVLERAELRPGDVLVDVGSGPGSAVIEAAKHHGVVEAIGVEPSRILRTASSWRALTRGVGGSTKFVAGTAESLPLATGSADVAIAVNSVHHWQDIDTAFAEIARILRPGGRFVVSEEDFLHPDHPDGDSPHREWPEVDYEHLGATLAGVGLKAEIQDVRVDGTPLKIVIAVKD